MFLFFFFSFFLKYCQHQNKILSLFWLQRSHKQITSKRSAWLVVTKWNGESVFFCNLAESRQAGVRIVFSPIRLGRVPQWIWVGSALTTLYIKINLGETFVFWGELTVKGRKKYLVFAAVFWPWLLIYWWSTAALLVLMFFLCGSVWVSSSSLDQGELSLALCGTRRTVLRSSWVGFLVLALFR